MEPNEKVLSFIAEWFDPQPQVIKQFLLKYHCTSNEVEMKDIQAKRMFLKKTKVSLLPRTNSNASRYDNDHSLLQECDFFLHAKISLLGRDMKLVEYADSMTRQFLESQDERTVCVLLPAYYEKLSEILTLIETKGGLTLTNVQSIRFKSSTISQPVQSSSSLTRIPNTNDAHDCIMVQVSDLLQVHIDDIAFHPEPMVVMAFRGTNSVAAIHALIQDSTFHHGGGGVHSGTSHHPNHGRPYPPPQLICASNTNEASVYSDFFFGEGKTKHKFNSSATLEKCTCCIIKPHAVKERLVGSILHEITNKSPSRQRRGGIEGGGGDFVISAISMFHLERSMAEEFLEVYAGVIPEYSNMVDEMCSGPVVVLEVRMKPQFEFGVLPHNDDEDSLFPGVVEKFRTLAGPWDVIMAKELFPGTLRAFFGRDRIRNAIHCTDLPKDGVLECEYFFRILASSLHA